MLQGVRLSYYDSKADVLLMSLTTTIPDHFDAYLIGFDAAPSAVPTAAVGIHQPDGSYKSFSRAGSISTDFPAPNFPPDEVQPTSATHFQARPCLSRWWHALLRGSTHLMRPCPHACSTTWVVQPLAQRKERYHKARCACRPPMQVTWSLGATVGGSSGSPLIDNSTNKVVGVLTGGYSACYNGLPDYYGRLSAVTGCLQITKQACFHSGRHLYCIFVPECGTWGQAACTPVSSYSIMECAMQAWPAGLYLYLASSQDTAHGASKSTAFIDPNQLGVVKASNTLGGAAARKHGPSMFRAYPASRPCARRCLASSGSCLSGCPNV